MKKILIVSAVVALVAALGVAPVLAKGPSGPSGKSDVTGHIYLLEKVPGEWTVVEDGAWGKLNFRCGEDGFSFVFNGHGLEAGESYALVNYLDPWPGNGSLLLAAGDADEFCDIHLEGSVPCLMGFDHEGYGGDYDGDPGQVGAKIWLVKAGDFDEIAGKMTAWDPTEYLFEEELVTCCLCDECELCLDNKYPSNWAPIDDDEMAGTLKYRCLDPGLHFMFAASGLEEGASYELINYLDPWPGNGSLLLASGTAADDGSINLWGYVDCLMPFDHTGYGGDYDDECEFGAKIWLVKADDFDESAGKMAHWNPSEYLFEMALVKCGLCEPMTMDIVEKTPVPAPDPYPIVDGGACGVLTYMCLDPGFHFTFSASGLDPSTSYDLINYSDDGWPCAASLLLASGVSNADGTINLWGFEPCLEDQVYTSGEYAGKTGAKIWLVLDSDFTEGTGMIAWHPADYLFETELVEVCACP